MSKCEHMILDGRRQHQDDIETYVRNSLKVSGPNIRHESALEIGTRSCDVFLWDMLVVRLLNKESARGDNHSIRAQLEALPNIFHDLFEDAILKRSSDTNQHLLLTLLWIMFAARPPIPSELYHGVLYANGGAMNVSVFNAGSSPSQFARCILNPSKGLAEISAHDAGLLVRVRVQFIHETVREYLRNGGMGRLENSICDNAIRLYNDILKTSCIEYVASAARTVQQLGCPLDAGSYHSTNETKSKTDYDGTDDDDEDEHEHDHDDDDESTMSHNERLYYTKDHLQHTRIIRPSNGC